MAVDYNFFCIKLLKSGSQQISHSFFYDLKLLPSKLQLPIYLITPLPLFTFPLTPSISSLSSSTLSAATTAQRCLKNKFRRSHRRNSTNSLCESMASKLHQLQSKACQAKQFVTKHGSVYYKQLLEKNKQYIKDPPTVETCNELSQQLFYTRLASIPARKEAFWKEVDYLKNMWKNRQELKVEDAGIAALFGIECFGWYCAGEIIGRGFTITGYYP